MPQSVRQENKGQPDLINVKRNPYLLDYEEQRRLREISGRGSVQGRRTVPQENRIAAGTTGRPRGEAGQRPQRNRAGSGAARRRRIVRRQRIAVGVWLMCMLVLTMVFVMGKSDASASGKENLPPMDGAVTADAGVAEPQVTLIQGLPAEIYAAHPDWQENFLTPNEYSRPGDPLEQVNSIFVHYTANPGTSAAQNRSYFEQQKDVHERSVSAHFIIGYEGEIIQCIPLDEIAYAVQTRNEDSISIECCFLAEDGSFTKETYDSLIELLAWLTDSYDLTPDDILRHYDCGGKKCPLYYTENPQEWEQLKADVKDRL